jgi:uncharacterized membrane protein
MYAIMLNQTTLFTVCLITHITNIRALATMYAIMLNQTLSLYALLLTSQT